MDNLSRINIFLEVAKHESFVGAARELGITSSAVSKQVQNLEHELKAKLFNRTTRNVALTEEGALFFERTRHALDDIAEAKEQLKDLIAKPTGTIKVSVPNAFGQSHLKKPLAEFARLYPEVTLDIYFDDRIVNIAEEGFDLVIRIADLQDSSMIARRLIDAPICVCASPEYLKKYGTPKTPEDLTGHNVVAYTRNKGAHEWRYKDNKTSYEGVVTLNSTIKADNAEMMMEASIQGLGIVIMPVFYLTKYLDNGQLVKLMNRHETWPKRNVYAIFQPNRYLSNRLRLLIEHLDAYCQNIR
jgi:DNA-binding transcriptional LysR family regulator